ncbi:MAG: hypothetical protein AABW93_00465 [Nanoarchaeota archaeon]
MVSHKAGQELFYREGEDLVLRVKVLEDKSNKTTEAYGLKIQGILRDGTSRFAHDIQLGKTFVCARERSSILGGLWELTEV